MSELTLTCRDCGCVIPTGCGWIWSPRDKGGSWGEPVTPLCETCFHKRDAAEDSFRAAALAIATERVDLLCRKQADYGPGNISSMGYAGLLVRMNDKMERLKHLMLSGREPDNEAVDDTLDDISNYALIWQMGKRGQWPVPFEPVVLRRMDDAPQVLPQV